MTVVVATFYKFVPIQDCAELQRSLQTLCVSINLRGTILLAAEGINATIAGRDDSVAQLIDWLQCDRRFSDLTVKIAATAESPFGRMKVKIKSEIVTLGQPAVSPNQQVGTYVSPREWNHLISDPEVVLVDARNEYEVNIGTFKGAINPHTQAFRQLPDYVKTHLNPQEHKKVAMFCTGGIRCEKATSYLLQRGFEEVYHLQGGILKYLEEIPETESLWEGECFIFDERVTVRHGLRPGSYDLCRACGQPISAEDKISPHYEASICCPHCYPNLTPEKRAKQQMRKYQYEQQHGKPLS
ncbi:MAG: rhodanese-related sulfurtransferase [Leptolyngbya sp. SIO1E4]|nr:rhodanese-related sulfurtransferase [Leptolyngbya sp. SIO1E4]